MEPGTLIANRFRIDRRIGKGGMGEVFAATNVQTGEAVALKLLRAEVKARRVAMERFRREARAGGFIKSAYVTEILEVDQDPERGIVLVFELLEGESLIE
ncbi:MAG: serine/threonine protein kinase, partial [Polyangiaceae bacterium]